MPETIKIRRFGGSLGFVIPKTVADAMALEEGDELFVSGSPEGLRATPFDPDFAAALEDARDFMRSHRDAFGELAK